MSLQNSIVALSKIPYYGMIPIPQLATLLHTDEQTAVNALGYLLQNQINLQEKYLYLITKSPYPPKVEQEFK